VMRLTISEFFTCKRAILQVLNLWTRRKLRRRLRSPQFEMLSKWLRFVAHFAKIKEAPPIHPINLRAFNLAYVPRVFESTISPAPISPVSSSSENSRTSKIASYSS
jgi:hypothetical protein